MTVENQKIIEAPSADIPQLIREIRRIGNNINQLLVMARVSNMVDADLLRQTLAETRAAASSIVDCYTVK